MCYVPQVIPVFFFFLRACVCPRKCHSLLKYYFSRLCRLPSNATIIRPALRSMPAALSTLAPQYYERDGEKADFYWIPQRVCAHCCCAPPQLPSRPPRPFPCSSPLSTQPVGSRITRCLRACARHCSPMTTTSGACLSTSAPRGLTGTGRCAPALSRPGRGACMPHAWACRQPIDGLSRRSLSRAYRGPIEGLPRVCCPRAGSRTQNELRGACETSAERGLGLSAVGCVFAAAQVETQQTRHFMVLNGDHGPGCGSRLRVKGGELFHPHQRAPLSARVGVFLGSSLGGPACTSGCEGHAVMHELRETIDDEVSKGRYGQQQQTKRSLTRSCGRDNYFSRPLALGRHPAEWNPADPARLVGHIQWNGARCRSCTPPPFAPPRCTTLPSVALAAHLARAATLHILRALRI